MIKTHIGPLDFLTARSINLSGPLRNCMFLLSHVTSNRADDIKPGQLERWVLLPSVSEGVDQITPMISSPVMCQLLRWSCRRKKQLPPRVRGWSGANFLMHPLENQRECEGSGTQHSYSTSLARSQGLTLARCCIQTRGLSRGIKIVMDSHTNWQCWC